MGMMGHKYKYIFTVETINDMVKKGESFRDAYKKLNKEIKSNKYEEGVTCPNCFSLLSDDQKKRFRMRQQQIQIQKKLGKKYLYQREFK